MSYILFRCRYGWVGWRGKVEGFYFFFFCLQGPKMCIPLAEESFCSDKLTVSISHIATVWHILQGAAVGTQMLRTIGITQPDSSCFLGLFFLFSFKGEGGLFFFSKSELPSRGSRKERELIHLHIPSPFGEGRKKRKEKESLYSHHNYWWAPLLDCYTLRPSWKQYFEDAQPTTRSRFLKFTWGFFPPVLILQSRVLEVLCSLFLPPMYCLSASMQSGTEGQYSDSAAAWTWHWHTNITSTLCAQ